MKNARNLKEYLGDKELYLKMVKIAIPISLQSLITVGINLMDTIMLSKMGDAQISASSLAGQFINLFMICCMGIGMGASVLTSRFWGMQDKHSLKKTITIMLRFVVVFAAIFTAITIISPEWIMRIYSDEAPIITHGVTYLKWMIPTYIVPDFLLHVPLCSARSVRSGFRCIAPFQHFLLTYFLTGYSSSVN